MSWHVKGFVVLMVIALGCSAVAAAQPQITFAAGHGRHVPIVAVSWPSYGYTYYGAYRQPYWDPYYGPAYWRPPVVASPGPVFIGPRIGMGAYIINPYGQGFRPVYVQPYGTWYGPYRY